MVVCPDTDAACRTGYPDGRPPFLPWRLQGSLPPHRFFPPITLANGKAFAAMDRLLDHARTGPLYLARPEIASIVLKAILQGTRYA